jgi:nucleotide-binding universal stress UspA family protein
MIPLDGSRLSESSLAYLEALQGLGELEIHLVSVANLWEEFSTLGGPEAAEREHNVLLSYVHEVARDIKDNLRLAVISDVVYGMPAETIIDQADLLKPDLVVISTHGRSGVSRWRFGSVADKVIRGLTCPTLVIGPKATEEERWIEGDLVPPFRHILLPMDGSSLAEEAVPVVKQFADALGSTVHIFRAVSVPAVYELETTGLLLDDVFEAGRAYVAEEAKRFAPNRTETEVRMGSAWVELERYIESNNIDLVIMTSHGRSAFTRTALGSVTDRLLGGKAPVLIVHPASRVAAQ